LKLESEDKQITLEFEPRGAQLHAYPSICVSIELTSRDVSCVLAAVWIELDRLSAFLAALDRLDASRDTDAVLEGVSPGELHVRVFRLNRRGHIALEIRLTGWRRIGDAWQRASYGCHICFELDPTALPGIKSAFRELIESQVGR